MNCPPLPISLSFWVELVGACNSIFSFLRDSTCWISWIILVWLIASLCSTFVDTNLEIAAADGAPVADATEFCGLAGALQYLTFTRPDNAYAVQQVCLHTHDPQMPHLAALKHILHYIQGTLHLGLLLRPSTSSCGVY